MGNSTIDLSAALNYIWDPTGAMAGHGASPGGSRMARSGLPASAIDTGFRRGDAQLWVDPNDGTVIYRLRGETADVFALNVEKFWQCA